MKKFKIYLAGRIPLVEEKEVDQDWRNRYAEVIKNIVPQAVILDPSKRLIYEADSKAVFGHDLFLIKISDVLLVNAEIQLGLGTSQELIIAKYFQKPIIAVSPKGSYYARPYLVNGNKIGGDRHPFLNLVADTIIENISKLGTALENIEIASKNDSQNWDMFIHEAIDYYLGKYFPLDEITKDVLRGSKDIPKR